MKAEQTWMQFEDMDQITPDTWFLKPNCVAKLHTASTKQCGYVGKEMSWEDLLVVIRREREDLSS